MATQPHITNLRKVGGSVMLTVPPAILEGMHLKTGAEVQLSVQGANLVISPSRRRPKYKLKDLLEQCKPGGRISKQDREWVDAPPVGREL